MPEPDEVIADLRDIDIRLTREEGRHMCHIWIGLPNGKRRELAPFEIDGDTRLLNALRTLSHTEHALRSAR